MQRFFACGKTALHSEACSSLLPLRAAEGGCMGDGDQEIVFGWLCSGVSTL
jgi:hypothetical protein